MGNKITKTFEEWCIENNKQDVLSRWDYEMNKGVKPSEVGCKTHKKYYFKCLKGLHESELKNLGAFTAVFERYGNSDILDCIQCNSFEQWCISNLSEEESNEILSRWDYSKNIDKNGNVIKPSDITYGSNGFNKKGYWFKCLKHTEHESELKRISNFISGQEGSLKCNQCNSFKQWCYDNMSKEKAEEILNRWDYVKNKCKPSEIDYATNKKFYFKCPKGLYSSELKDITSLTIKKTGKFLCNQCNSFEQWCYDNLSKEEANKILSRWDYELNNCKPSEIAYSTNKKRWFKCPIGIHNSELKDISNFIQDNCSLNCRMCNSFAQWGIDNICEDFLELYWDYEKNNELSLNPWKVDKCSTKKVWIKCQEKDYHGSYDVHCYDFVIGNRCPYCNIFASKKVHPLDSLGQYIIDNYGQDFLNKIWSDKNKKSPYEYAPMSNQKVWWRCIDGEYEDYSRNIASSNICEFRCLECQYSKGEKKIENWLINKKYKKIYNFDKNKYYVPQKKFKDLIGLKGGNLSYDFYLPNHNLLIEHQGEQHEKYVKGFHKSKKDFEKQIEHDKRKKEYAVNNNIKLLEIWYYDYNNIEEILSNYII